LGKILGLSRRHGEGLPRELDFRQVFDIAQYFGLDPYQQFWLSTTEPTVDATQHHVEGIVANMDDYRAVKPRLYPDHSTAIEAMRSWAERQAGGQVVVWATLEGFFWFPRTLMNIEQLSFAFYDQPELVHAINSDLLSYNLDLVRQMGKACAPTFMTLAEDMSYNHGPMISQKTFQEFLAPYYRQLIAALNELNIMLIVDTDGDVTMMVPWLQALDVAGVLPLERQAGVDGMSLRLRFPTLRMVGHYNKLVMNRGEAAMRSEFERLVPLMKTGGFIPSVDHQTPPGVSIKQYRLYLRLLREYVRC
jgi:hypothetical protein